MPQELYALAEREGIVVECWDFRPPIQGMYMKYPGMPPVIGLTKALYDNRVLLRTVLAEELGHHFTTTGDGVPEQILCYRDQLLISKIEYKARRWAAKYLMPLDRVLEAHRKGLTQVWEFAEYFGVTQELVEFRASMYDMQNQEDRCG